MLEVYCDGGSRGNPGPSAFGYIVKKLGKIIKEGNGYIGIATNNIAEYTAVIESLKYLSKDFKGEKLMFNLDSMLAVKQLNGEFKIKNSKIRELVFKIKELEPNFKSISYTHITRDKNTQADRQVNIALNLQNGT